jgi:tetratricopeptide (TPR) repeat protein
MLRLPSVRSLALALALLSAACRHIPTERERQAAEIHYDLGIAAQQAGNVQEAVSEFRKALELDPELPEAHNAMGVLLHLAFRRHDEAVTHYQKAIEVRPTFSEAKANLANVHLDKGRYDEAIKLYEEVLNDMLYPTPYFAHGNMGWAFYKKGEMTRAVDSIKTAVTLNPGFCLGYRNLGLIYQDTGKTEDACRQFARYREACPDTADAYLREGVCQAKLGQVDAARQSFSTCEAKASQATLKDECRTLREHL